MYTPYDDPVQALREASRLVELGLWHHREDPLGRRHAYERQFVPEKDPSLRAAEIVAVFQSASSCRHEGEGRAFFRAEARIEGLGWSGIGRVLFHVDADIRRRESHRVVLVTAFRVRGWQER